MCCLLSGRRRSSPRARHSSEWRESGARTYHTLSERCLRVSRDETDAPGPGPRRAVCPPTPRRRPTVKRSCTHTILSVLILTHIRSTRTRTRHTPLRLTTTTHAHTSHDVCRLDTRVSRLTRLATSATRATAYARSRGLSQKRVKFHSSLYHVVHSWIMRARISAISHVSQRIKRRAPRERLAAAPSPPSSAASPRWATDRRPSSSRQRRQPAPCRSPRAAQKPSGSRRTPRALRPPCE